VTGRHKGPKR